LSARIAAVWLTLSALPVFAAELDGEVEIPDHYVSVSTGINLGLIEFDLVSDHLIASVSTAMGIALVTNGQFSVAEVRVGYAIALSPPGDSMWFFDAFVEALPGRVVSSLGFPVGHTAHEGLYCGFGLALGFRYVHRSGMVLGFKLPLVGFSVGEWVDGDDPGTNLLSYYAAHAFSSSLFTLGLRF
jgi:hypothetical protein